MNTELLSLMHEKKNRSCRLRFVSNLLLVIEGKRLSFRSDIYDRTLNEELIREALLINEDLISLNYPREEPLLFLKHNSLKIKNCLSKDNIHEAFGLVLEYPYIERNIGPHYKLTNKILVSYHVKYCDTISQLYGFSIPIAEYNDDIKNSVEARLKIYSETLAQYNISIWIDVMSYT